MTLPALDDAFARELPELAVPWEATRFPRPELLVLNEPLAAELGFDPVELNSDSGARLLTGAELAPGSRPVAQAYAGHQFGGYSPRLGDGRALLLGEARDTAGRPRDLHLKGSGRTPFARGADGFAAVGPMLREYLMGEAMHALGIPTTRALAVVGTGGRVLRDDSLDPLPGAVLVRTAASHLRVGTFQYAASLADRGVLARLTDFALARHFPDALGDSRPALRLLEGVVERQARLLASWMLVGFVHGVMNTDNTTISGETIDYGPCAFIDAYDPAAVFSSIDRMGRYAYGRQPGIALWNLTRLAEALLPQLAREEAELAGSGVGWGAGGQGAGAGGEGAGVTAVGGEDAAEAAALPEAAVEAAKELAIAALECFSPLYDRAWLEGMRAKLGLASAAAPDDRVRDLAAALLAALHEHAVDYTGAFRTLAEAARGNEGPLRELFPADSAPVGWLSEWLALGPDPSAMDAVNPIYVPRNHLADEALVAATAGDLEPFGRLLDAVTRPFEARAGLERYALPAPPGAPRHVTYCGT